MTDSQLMLKVGGVILAGVGGFLILTNPGQKAYQENATEQLVSYLKNDICTKASSKGKNFLEGPCKSLVDISRPQIEQVIAQKTKRQNMLFLSIYQTDLSFFEPLPSYRFEVIGVLQQFYIYDVEEL